MIPGIGEIIVWLIVGALAGTLTGAVVKGTKEGYGKWKNLGIGLLGAIIGGLTGGNLGEQSNSSPFVDRVHDRLE